jgi:hypothetical protein
MERRTGVAAVIAAGMSLAAGSFALSAIGEPAGAGLGNQPVPTTSTLPVPQTTIVHQVMTIDDVVIVTTTPTEVARPVHPTPTGSPAQLTTGGAP